MAPGSTPEPEPTPREGNRTMEVGSEAGLLNNGGMEHCKLVLRGIGAAIPRGLGEPLPEGMGQYLLGASPGVGLGTPAPKETDCEFTTPM